MQLSILNLSISNYIQIACSHQTLWWQKLVSEHIFRAHREIGLRAQQRFEGLLAEGAFSISNAVKTLRDDRYVMTDQSPATKTSFYINNMFFDSDRIAEYLTSLRPSAPLFALIKFRLGAHTLRVETDRWLIPKPPREQGVCRHCTMQAIY